jgi:uncharacterized protein (TIGR03118 family)
MEPLESRALLSMGGNAHHMLRHPRTSFTQNNLVSNVPGGAAHTDPDLVNAWGLAASPAAVGGPWWVNDNGSGLSTLYDGNGAKQTLKVVVPPPHGSTPGTASTPTGIVFNGSSDFSVSDGAASGPSFFVFATEDGTISGWNPAVGVPPGGGPPSTQAILAVDNSAGGAVYKGLAMGSVGSSNFLYATNFHAGTIDVFNGSFGQVTPGTGAITGTFKDRRIPRGFAPFGIANVNGDLFVTYAKQDADKHDDVAGRRLGFVDEFDTSGHLIQRVASRGMLNSPWGLAVAPSSFGRFGGDLLVGNFGDGRINAFRPVGHRRFRSDGQLRDAQNRPIAIDGLWGLAAGNDGMAGPSSTLFFTAGPHGEADGLFGTLTAST